MACANHPGVDERFECVDCAQRWCGDCARPIGVSNKVVCPACGHPLRKAAPPLDAMRSVEDAVRRVATMEGVTTALGFAACYALSRYASVLVIPYIAALVGYYFTIIHHVGDARDGLPGPSDATDHWVEIVGHALRGVVLTALAFVPLIVWFGVERDMPSLGTALALVGLGQLYMPAMLLSVTLTNSLVSGMFPVNWVLIISRAPSAYLRFVGLWSASLLAGAIVVALSAPLGMFGILGTFAMATAWSLFWFAQAVLVGNFVRANASAFGWD